MKSNTPPRKRSIPRQALTLTAKQVTSVAENVAATLCTNQQTASEQLFTVFMQRFDKVDTDNHEIKLGLATHITDDAKVHKVVEQHKTYWRIATKIALGITAGGFAILLAWIKLG